MIQSDRRGKRRISPLPTHSPDPVPHLVAPVQRECGQLKRRDPALGAVCEQGTLVVGQIDLSTRKIQRRFVVREAQIGSAQFDELSLCAQPRQRERRHFAADDDEVHCGRHLRT